ncbi:hypothetical protein [Sphingobium yanoikuyae]|jgi:hypothetical protein|uniref:hypothetical protein n=1 Tax=Sphingobium yanoikuyae TaxID=13690 RepID=UPI0035C7CB7E
MSHEFVIDVSDILDNLNVEDALNADLEKLVAGKIALDATTNLVLAAPVDTGHFRHNFQTTLGAPAMAEIAGEDKSGGGAIGRAQATVAARKAYQDVYITNPTVYTGPLLDGHSKQAPEGWADNAIDAATAGFTS